ncbi:hypothetical protein MAE02_27590 [Microvirga aerophila]|uniref:Uncharacterized protein n=1 Tax=Microvirga aerophila TaxID=670291 RepID=A0A512BSU6_9HYPH|nr:hypothetical protein MAE02_27590 [Microvirga aerophila]
MELAEHEGSLIDQFRTSKVCLRFLAFNPAGSRALAMGSNVGSGHASRAWD